MAVDCAGSGSAYPDRTCGLCAAPVGGGGSGAVTAKKYLIPGTEHSMGTRYFLHEEVFLRFQKPFICASWKRLHR